MSTTLEAASAATLVQLLCSGCSIYLRESTMSTRWRVEITAPNGASWRGKSEHLMAAFAQAVDVAGEHAPIVLATMSLQPLTTELGDVWRSIAAIASEFDYVRFTPTAPEKRVAPIECPSITISSNGHELGLIDVYWVLPNDEAARFGGASLLAALERLDQVCQTSVQTTDVPELREHAGNELAPAAGTIEA